MFFKKVVGLGLLTLTTGAVLYAIGKVLNEQDQKAKKEETILIDEETQLNENSDNSEVTGESAAQADESATER